MRLIASAVAVSLTVVAAACSSTTGYDPAPSPTTSATTTTAFDPSGMYDFVASMGAETRTGTLEIERSAANGFEGEAWLEGEGDPARIVSGGVTGNHVILNGIVGMNDVTFEIDFTGNTFAGTITAGDNVIDVTGTRRGQ